MGVTIVDIAKRVGVTHPVVSKVLNGGTGATAGASEDTRRKIFDVARELGYRPHAASRALRNQKFHNVGILLGGVEGFYLPQKTLASLGQTLSDRGYTLTLVCTEEFNAECLLNSPLLRDHVVDVLLIGYVYDPPAPVVKAVEDLGVRVVWLNRCAENDAVYVDEADAGAQLVSHLASLGHDRITFVDYSGEGGQNPVIAQRLVGIGNRADELGIAVSHITHKYVPRGKRKKDAMGWLARKNRPRAIIANTLSAGQVILQAAERVGLEVPNDLAIASFSIGYGHLVPEPSITCVIHPDVGFGEAAALMALEKTAKSPAPQSSTRLQYSLAVCGSTVGEAVE